MSRPFRAKSHDAVTSSGVGESYDSKGHNSIGLFVVARNLDTANDTLDVRVEGAPTDGQSEWATIDTKQGGGGSKTTRLSMDVNDFEDTAGDGTYVGFLYAHGIPVEFLRVNITTLTDNANSDLEVDTYIMGANNGGTGHAFEHY